MVAIPCPFCLGHHDLDRGGLCPVKNLEIPGEYVRGANVAPPLFLATVGFKNHGKSNYLSRLFETIEHLHWRLPNARGTYPVGKDSLSEMKRLRARLKARERAETTSMRIAPPILFHASGLGAPHPFHLVFYDLAGEWFDAEADASDQLSRVLEAARTVWLFASLPDLVDAPEDGTLSDLLQNYCRALEGVGVDPAGRDLIVVYTKADKANFGSNHAIDDYLDSDPFARVALDKAEVKRDPSFSFPEYCDGIRAISEVLERFTLDSVDGGSTLLSIARSKRMSVHFCVTSALGGDIEADGAMQFGSLPARILDPLFLALQLAKVVRKGAVRVIYDPELILERELIDDAIGRLGRTATLELYQLGRSKAVAQLPDIEEGCAYAVRAVGSVLEALLDPVPIVLLTRRGAIDLNDFATTDWASMLLAVVFGEDEEFGWGEIHRYNKAPTALALAELIQSWHDQDR